MFEILSKGFRTARQKLQGFEEITEENINSALRDIRISLLEADVEYNLVKQFIERVKKKAIGEIVQTRVTYKGKKFKVTPAQHFIAICQKELEAMMGPADPSLIKAPRGKPTSVMMIGLQGSGKTTTAAKLARYLKKKGHRPLLVAADIYRPAAIEQLKILGEKIEVPVFTAPEGTDPVQICESAKREAEERKYDFVIIDTAGRLAIDEPLMQELERIKARIKPENILLVVDAMMGQDAVNTAKAFHERLKISGVILTKLDGDARGGAALSIKAVTGAPIKYLGVGERLENLEEFRPDGLASRILGFGDIVGLVKDFEEVIDEKKAEEDAMRMLKGEFTFYDFLEQIKMIKSIGSLQDLVEKLPFFPDGLPEGMQVDDKELVKIEAMINSMTHKERLDPSLFEKEPSRYRRVAKGSGRSEAEVRELVKKFMWMKNLMSGIGRQASLLARIPGFKQLAMARKLKDALQMQGGDPLSQLTSSLMESAVASTPSTPARRRFIDPKKKKAKRKREKKARKKSRKK